LQLTLSTFFRLAGHQRQEPDTPAVPAPRTDAGEGACPVSAPRRAEPTTFDGHVDEAEALTFIEQFYAESPVEVGTSRGHRMEAVLREIGETGTYRHTEAELTFGARVAWRNAARCVGRLYWQSLHVRDRRRVRAPAEVAAECAEHLRGATRGGRIRSTVTVFAPDSPGLPGPHIHNEQLIRYAGHREPDGSVTGDPRYVEFTDTARALGWRPPGGTPGRFDVLPLLISEHPGSRPEVFEVPRDAVREVELRHPDYPWFAELGLRWHAVPAICGMPLSIGGIRYPAAPFNGWYLSTEIGARNLSDTGRYDLLPEIADRLWLDTSSERTLWRDRALVELVRAVQWSFDTDGVAMSDHHTESQRFLEHVSREQEAGRRCPTDWSWIVPPMSGGLTPVFHRYYDDPEPDLRPAFLDRATG
jgi:nitric-oxide synthase